MIPASIPSDLTATKLPCQQVLVLRAHLDLSNGFTQEKILGKLPLNARLLGAISKI